ncbi:hypothetical protein [Streptomyces sp. NPDC057428]|uniref:hypothetical protein n=1 Tax=Streptomyces sp. NPDC057428 TaxID=3346129 RepID=UPI0036BF13A7
MGMKGQDRRRRRRGQDKDAAALQAFLSRVDHDGRRSPDTKIEEATLRAGQLAAVACLSAAL